MDYNCKAIDVMIAGAQKAGTSSLGDYLNQHPKIVTHSQLEMAFFVRDEEYEMGYENVYPKYFQSSKFPEIFLAKNVGIMYFPFAMERLRNHNPNCKIIVLLREPVSRAYSAYWYMRRVGYETAPSFAEALALEDERKSQNLLKWSPCLYRDRGIYHLQIKNLYHYFGIKNVQVILLGDLIAHPDRTMEKVLGFIGLEHMPINTSAKSNTAKVARSEALSRLLTSSGGVKQFLKNIIPTEYLTSARRYVQTLNERSVEIPPIEPQCQYELAAFFKPHNQKLETLLNRSLAAWTLPEKTASKTADLN